MKLCRICGDPGAQGHHTLPKSVWPELRDHPDVFLPLCVPCHGGWHDRARVVYREDLPARTWALIEAHASPEWCDRWYPSRPGGDLPF